MQSVTELGKRHSASVDLGRQRPLNMRQSAKINIFSATVHMIWKCWRVSYSEFFGNYSQCTYIYIYI